MRMLSKFFSLFNVSRKYKRRKTKTRRNRKTRTTRRFMRGG